MPNTLHPFQRPDTLRSSIAQAAARLMAEEGIDDYNFAKRKAARQLGLDVGVALPTNNEIDQALQAYRNLYRDEEDDLALAQLRSAALEVMQCLAPFEPYLTGAVLEGTATGFSEIELEIYADSAKDVEIFILGQNLRYEHREPRRGSFDAPEAILVFDWDDAPCKLFIFTRHAERTPRRVTHGGRVASRARLAAVRERFSDNTPA